MSQFRFSQEQTCDRDQGVSGLCGSRLQGIILGRGLGDRKQKEGQPYKGSCQGEGDWSTMYPLGNLRSSTEFSNWSTRDLGYLSTIFPSSIANSSFCGDLLWHFQLPGPETRHHAGSHKCVVAAVFRVCVRECWEDLDGVFTALLQ